MGMNLVCFPVPNLIHSSTKSNCWNVETEITTTSVSDVFTVTLCNLFRLMFRAWSIVISLFMITRGKVIPRQIFIVWQNLLIQCCDNGLRTDSRKQIWGYLISDVFEESSFVVVISKEVAQFLGFKALPCIELCKCNGECKRENEDH